MAVVPSWRAVQLGSTYWNGREQIRPWTNPADGFARGLRARRISRSKMPLTSATLDDFQDFDALGPREPCRPRFSRETFQTVGSTVHIPVIPPSGAPQKRRRMRSGRWRYKKVTPGEALTGAAISGACATALWVGVSEAAAFVTENPPGASLPQHLAPNVHSAMVAMVWGIGGMAFSMFAVGAVGLTLLAFHEANAGAKP